MNINRFVEVSTLKKKYIETRSRFYVYRSNLEVLKAFRPKKSVSSNNTGVVGGITASGIAMFAVIGFIVSGHNPPETTASPKSTFPLISLANPIEQKITAPFSIISKEQAKLEPDEMEIMEIASLPEKETVQPIDPVEIVDAMDAPYLPFLPKPVASMPRPEGNFNYLLAVDKVRGELLVLKESEKSYIIANRFKSIFGSKLGDKMKTGDLKTPEGLYYIVSIKEDDDLPARYGPRAYVLDYPNTLDRKNGKSGYGIWIHGSGLGEKIEPTEGCVEVNDKNIIDLGWYATVGTPVYIFPEEFEIPITGTKIAKNIIDPDTLYAIKELRHSPEAEKIFKTALSNM